MKVLVTGGAGQLARAICTLWHEHEVIVPSEEELDICMPETILRYLKEVQPDALINTAAFTQVDRCESEYARALVVNAEAVGWMAEACNQFHAILVQISTDYVFDGRLRRPYSENDVPNPINAYGRSKLLGETYAYGANEHLVLRTSWLYDRYGQNFYTTMLKLAREGRPVRVVNDQTGSPTTCRALAKQISVALKMGWRGLFHATCAGQTTWYDFSDTIFSLHGLPVDLLPCRTSELAQPAIRPSYSVLDGRKRITTGGDVMPNWHDALKEIVHESCDHPAR